MKTCQKDNISNHTQEEEPDDKITDKQASVLFRKVETKHKLEGTAGKDNKKERQVPFSKLYSEYANRSEKCMLYFGWLFAALAGATFPLIIFWLGPVFDSFTEESTPDAMADKILGICWILFGLAGGMMIFSFFQNWLLIKASSNIAAKIKTRYLQAVLNQESAWYDQTNYLEMASRITKETDAIADGIGSKYGNVLYSYCACVTGFATGLYKGWSLCLALLGIGPIFLIGMGCFGAVMSKRTLASMKAYGQSAGYAEQALSAIRVMVSFGQEALEIRNYNKYVDMCTQASQKAAFSSGFSLGFFNFTIYLAYSYAFIMGSIWIDKPFYNQSQGRDYMAGDVIGCFFGTLIGLAMLGGAGPALNSVNVAKTTGSIVFGIIDRKVQIDQDCPNAKPHKLQGEIEFKNVTFYYPTRTEAPVMVDFSHKFEMGKTTAIVGPSGSGKSTTIQLVERFYDPNEGEVLIDGVNLTEINLRQYRQQIGYVGQEPVMFNISIKENIKMGKPDATDQEIEEALKAVNAWDFVSKYPKGMDENVGAGGGQLSGGQKQRIALARAFIKKPKVLIFDEATSALDKANEAIVVQAIEALKAKLGGAVTTLVIAHRLSTVRSADNIIVMKKGWIAEQGTHDELVSMNGIYAKLNAADEAAAKKEAEKQAQAAIQQIEPEEDEQDQRLIRQSSSQKRKKSRRLSAKPSINVAETKEVDPVAKKMMLKAQTQLKAENNELDEQLDDLLNPKKQKGTFRKIMQSYSKPLWMILMGFLGKAIFGVVAPLYGFFIMKTMNELNEGYAEREIAEMNNTEPEESVLDKSLPWCYIMIAAAFLIFLGKALGGVMLSKVSENITGKVRQDLYQAILRKDIGWHDHRENSAGILTGTLASDVQLLNGVSSEGLGSTIESVIAVMTGVIASFILSWPIALVTICLLPIFLICGAIQSKAQHQNMMNVEEQEGSEDMEQSDQAGESKLLCSDAIANYKTVASFGNDQILIERFAKINAQQAANENKSAKTYALSYALSVAINNGGSFAILYIALAEFYRAYPTYEYTQFDTMMMAMFVFIFGAIAASHSISMGPDVGKATMAAMKIFQIIRTPSKVDTGVGAETYQTKRFVKYQVQSEGKNRGLPIRDANGNKVELSKSDKGEWIDGVVYESHPTKSFDTMLEAFEGRIEFRNVWFRYPTRLQQWVFKGLNLTIEPKDNIAIVGESGQGKSTFIALVMRYYDPEFGQVLVDGVDVKTMNVNSLRRKLGLVQQEPMLFNYTLKENILYGRLDASNEEIYRAAQQANALEFICPHEADEEAPKAGEYDDLSQAFSDDNEVLLNGFIKYKEQMLQNIDLSLMGRAKIAKINAKGGKNQNQSEEQKMLVEYMGMHFPQKLAVQEAEYAEIKRSLEALVKKDRELGKFEEMRGLVDTRTDKKLLARPLDQGFEVFAGTRGSKLSGGQKQRIAIARAIVRQPGILLLDEATSALDEDSQAKVQEALYSIMGNRTSIVVAHRMTTVEKCNRLAVIDDGVIVEEGSFDELMSKQDGKFSNLAGGMKKAETKAAKRASITYKEE